MQAAGTAVGKGRAGNCRRGGEETNIGTGLGAATTLTVDDAAAIGNIDGIRYSAAGVKMRGWLSAGEHRAYAPILGTDAAFPSIYGDGLLHGKFFKPRDVAAGAQVIVLGPALRDRLFAADVNPVGQGVHVRNQ